MSQDLVPNFANLPGFGTDSRQGAPYKFGVKVRSKAFSEAPEPVMRALHMVLWAAKAAVDMTAKNLGTRGEDTHENVPLTQVKEFNEMLALGYMKEDRISVRIGDRCHVSYADSGFAVS